VTDRPGLTSTSHTGTAGTADLPTFHSRSVGSKQRASSMGVAAALAISDC
jgi:hypothetical protein